MGTGSETPVSELTSPFFPLKPSQTQSVTHISAVCSLPAIQLSPCPYLGAAISISISMKGYIATDLRLGMVAPVSQLAHLNRNLPRNELSFCWQWSRSDIPPMSHYFSRKCGPPLHPKPPGSNNNQDVLARAPILIINYEISQIATLASLVLVVNDATTCFCWTKPSFIDFATVCGRTQMATSANADDELRPKYTIFNQRRSSRVVPTNRIQRSNCLDQWAGGSPLVPQAGSNFHFR